MPSGDGLLNVTARGDRCRPTGNIVMRFAAANQPGITLNATSMPAWGSLSIASTHRSMPSLAEVPVDEDPGTTRAIQHASSHSREGSRGNVLLRSPVAASREAAKRRDDQWRHGPASLTPLDRKKLPALVDGVNTDVRPSRPHLWPAPLHSCISALHGSWVTLATILHRWARPLIGCCRR
jgi:hypothetical protein